MSNPAASLRQAGRPDLISVGIDGFPTMLKAIEQGLVQATMAQIPYQMGKMAVADAIRVMKGEAAAIPALQYQDAVLITKENVGQFKASDFYGPSADSM